MHMPSKQAQRTTKRLFWVRRGERGKGGGYLRHRGCIVADSLDMCMTSVDK